MTTRNMTGKQKKEPLFVNAWFAFVVMILISGGSNICMCLHWLNRFNEQEQANQIAVAEAHEDGLFSTTISDEDMMTIVVKVVNDRVAWALSKGKWDDDEQNLTMAAHYLNAYMADKVAKYKFDRESMEEAMSPYGDWGFDPNWGQGEMLESNVVESETKKGGKK